MEYLLDGRQMKAVDAYNIEELGIPSLVLMERAALAAADLAASMVPAGGRVLAVCGTGNNGADALAAARILFLRGYEAEAVLAGNLKKATEENRLQQEIIKKLGIPLRTAEGALEYDMERGYALILDGLFGVGLSRPIEGRMAGLVEAVNRAGEKGAKILALDIPSGVYAGGGVSDPAVRADATVTFGFHKLGMVLYPGALYCGRVSKADIGFAKPPWLCNGNEEPVRSFLPGEAAPLPPRPPQGHKGTFGRVLLAAGSAGMCGAAFLSAMAAYRAGAGLVRILTVEENIPVLKALAPEAVLSVCRVENGRLGEETKKELPKLMEWADVFAAGPGLSQEPYAGELLSLLLKEARGGGKPAVLDADALNILAKERELLGLLSEKMIVTPHLGEMSRLTGQAAAELKSGLLKAAQEFHLRFGPVCVLKDARTAVASEKGLYLNRSGNDGMGTGGSGDVLAGILAGLLAGGLSPEQAAETGVYLHGLAGDRAAAEKGRRAMTARDILDHIGTVLKSWEEYHGDI